MCIIRWIVLFAIIIIIELMIVMVSRGLTDTVELTMLTKIITGKWQRCCRFDYDCAFFYTINFRNDTG